MQEVYQFKVVVAGPFNAGKTTLIDRISDSPVVGTEQPTSGTEAAVKATTTVGMEYGTYRVDDPDCEITLFLYGVPGQERFSFMWDIVADGMDGLIVLVDATDEHTWPQAATVGRHFLRRRPTPAIVAANRAKPGDPSLDRLRAEIDLPGAEIVACDVTDAASARDVLVDLLLLVLEGINENVAIEAAPTSAARTGPACNG